MEGEDDLVGEVLAGRYRIVRLIQRGGMGAVYEAVQEPLGRRVAIKVLHSHLASDEVSLERFRREAEATATLHHPHIVQVSDYQARPGEPAFLVMEYLTGRSLAEVMREDGILPPERVVHVAVQVLDALGAAHAAGIVHRDLKPTNVLLGSSAGLRDVVTIFDFGIAKLIEPPTGSKDETRARARRDRLTMQGALVGTPAYMAPEQASGKEIDARADLYALGVLMYAMLAGRLPYASRDPSEILRLIQTQKPTPLTELRPDLDPDLVEVVERALEKDPEARWQSADEMRRALARWQRRMGIADGELRSSSAPPPAAASEAAARADAAPPSERRRWAVAPWALVAALVGAAGLGALVMYVTRPPGERLVLVPSMQEPAGVVDARAVDPVAPVATVGAESDAGTGALTDVATPGARSPVHVQRGARGARAVDAGRPHRFRFQAAAPTRMYAPTDISDKIDALADELADCTEGQDIPNGAAPPVWHLEVSPDGDVRAVRTTVGEWPIAAVNCVTRTITGLYLGQPRSAEGGQVVLTPGPTQNH